jgi:glycosyltransferase involved in cell wall biosynthesis
MREVLGDRFRRLVLIGPQLDPEEYERRRGELGKVNEAESGVTFIPAHPTNTSRLAFWFTQGWREWRTVSRAVREASVVQSGMSTELGRPLMAMASVAAWWHRRPLVFVVDIDFRQHAKRFYLMGEWSFKSYLVNRYVYDPLKWLQVWLAPKISDLVLLKSMSLVRDFGRRLPHVKNFFDTVHSSAQVMTGTAASQRIEWLRRVDVPLKAVYFGRLAPKKGVDLMIDAVGLAKRKGVHIELNVIGGGECQAVLERQVQTSGLGDRVSFHPPVPYGEALFDRLRHSHVCLAAPRVEDTPRAAFDAMARGLPLVAFDITYFKDLAEESQAVALASWPRPDELAQRLAELSADREQLAQMASHALQFAARNTQSHWLETRMTWLYQFALAPR